MFKYIYFVKCPGWKAGGYRNAGFAKTKADIKKHIQQANERYAGTECSVSLLKVIEISDAEFAKDYIH